MDSSMVPNQDALDLKRLAVATVRHSIAFVLGRSVPFSSVFRLTYVRSVFRLTYVRSVFRPTYVPVFRPTYVPFSVLSKSRFSVLRTFRFPS